MPYIEMWHQVFPEVGEVATRTVDTEGAMSRSPLEMHFAVRCRVHQVTQDLHQRCAIGLGSLLSSEDIVD